MKKSRFLANGLVVALAAGALSLGLPAAASATEQSTYGGEVCTPSEAWTEYIEHPAVGEPTITVTNPDYKPAVEEVSHIVTHPAVTKLVEHPAETKVVKHEAVTHTEYRFAKFTRERIRTLSIYGWGDWTGYGSWSKYSPETHTSWEESSNAIGSPQFHSSGYRNGGFLQWERQWQAQHDGQTRTVTDKAAWDETVVVKDAWTETVVLKEAWDEKIIDVPGKPAIGEPTLTVTNPDYKEARTEEVKHEAVTCPAPQPKDKVTQEQVTPIIPCDAVAGDEIETTTTVTTTPYVLVEGEWVLGKPVVTTEDSTYVVTEEDVANTEDCAVVTPPVEEKPTAKPAAAKVTAPKDGLAETGLDTTWALTGGAVGVAALALGTLLFARRRQTASMTDSE